MTNEEGIVGGFGQAGSAVEGIEAGGRYVFANLAELDQVIAEWQSLREGIQTDGDRLKQAMQMIRPPAEDIMSRVQAEATVRSLRKAVSHNKAMLDYTDTFIAKLHAARVAYASNEQANEAKMRISDEN